MSDNLLGISKAIALAYQSSKIQKCVTHQISNNMRFVNYKQQKYLSKIWMASNLENALNQFKEKWSKD